MNAHALAKLCIALAAATAASLAFALWLLFARAPRATAADAMLDASVREAAIEELVELAGGGFDTFPDPDVGRVLQPGLEDYAPRADSQFRYSSNRHGMREREIPPQKAPNTWRLILLGDSFVFGQGVTREERVAAKLEAALRERATFAGTIEVLAIGVPSWNLLAECAYLRRSLDVLQPDAVVHVVVRNDLNDNHGVRGFGAMATFSDAVRSRADGMIHMNAPREALRASQVSWLTHSLDAESRERFRAGAVEIRRLHDALRAIGSAYRLVLYWSLEMGLARRALTAHTSLEAPPLVFPSDFCRDEDVRLDRLDPHWNAHGSQVVAEILYGYLEATSVLTPLAAAPWPEAVSRYRDLGAAGDDEAEADQSVRRRLNRMPIVSTLDFTDLRDKAKSQVHGGIERTGHVHPYASVILKREGRHLHVRGQRLGAAGLDGHVEVFVEEIPLAALPLGGTEPIDEKWTLPDTLLDRDYVTVSFQSDDYVYDTRYLRLCQCFKLESVGIEP